MARTPFPLQWPEGSLRSFPEERTRSRFNTGLSQAGRRLLAELGRLGATNIVVTSDMPTRQNGLPYGGASDPGIAVWFVLGNQERVMCCDRWDLPTCNIHAITLTVQAIRGIGRWGAADVVARAMDGFRALPPATDGVQPGSAPNPATQDWRAILCMTPAKLAELRARSESMGQFKALVTESVKRAYITLMKSAHPDAGGTHEQAVGVTAALDAAIKDIEANRIYA